MNREAFPMRSNISVLLLTVLAATAGCQETSTTTGSATGAGAASTPAATSMPTETPAATGGAAATDLTATDKTMEVALPGDRSATLRYADIKVGDGSIAGAGKVAMVSYNGFLTDGTKFDSSYDRGRPYQFRIGEVPPEVIEGWDKGIRGMRVGGKRKLVVPAELGYGSRGYPPVIPPNATLVFDVELVGIQ
jgi:peptidylprolyl isomerase